MTIRSIMFFFFFFVTHVNVDAVPSVTLNFCCWQLFYRWHAYHFSTHTPTSQRTFSFLFFFLLSHYSPVPKDLLSNIDLRSIRNSFPSSIGGGGRPGGFDTVDSGFLNSDDIGTEDEFSMYVVYHKLGCVNPVCGRGKSLVFIFSIFLFSLIFHRLYWFLFISITKCIPSLI